MAKGDREWRRIERVEAWPACNKAKFAKRTELLADLRNRLDSGEITTDQYEEEFLVLQAQARAGKL